MTNSAQKKSPSLRSRNASGDYTPSTLTAITLPADSWPREVGWSCLGCGKGNEAQERSCTSCTGGKRQRIWALYGSGEVLTTWMRLLFPAEAAHPTPSILLSTPDVLRLCLSPHDLRRTAARTAFDRGANLVQVQAMLGHASPDTTARYIGSYESDDTTAVDFITY